MNRQTGGVLAPLAARHLTSKPSSPLWAKGSPKWPHPFAIQSAPFSSSSIQRSRNISLFGPPGSGKGSYGKHFAKALEIPVVTTSDVLRKLRPDLVDKMAEGKLVDDKTVGQTILEGLKEMKLNGRGYILDGFPRTLEQVALMEDTWPESFKVQTVVHLEVPEFVCSTKLLGRRGCSNCGKSYNVNGVDQDGWRMPPFLPKEGQTCESATKEDMVCDYSVKRDDDTPEIVQERLKVYHHNADPILDYIRDNAVHKEYRLLTLRPYNGFDDLPELVEKLRREVDR